MQHTPEALERMAFVKQLETVSDEIAAWAENQLLVGQSVEQIKERLRRVMRIAAPIRAAETPIPAPAPGYIAAYADMVLARGPEVIRAELIRLQCKIMEAQRQLERYDPAAASRALRN